VSETETLSAEAIALHFGAYARGTIAEGAELEVICVHVEAKCGGCGAVYRPEHHVLVCPACGAVGGEELGERGIWVEEVGIED
jgi:hydrogenase nickel incorporation protein HypA/HybF